MAQKTYKIPGPIALPVGSDDPGTHLMKKKSKWQQEFDALPEWAKQMVSAVTKNGLCCHGYGHEDMILAGTSAKANGKHRGFFMGLDNDRMQMWSNGFDGLCELARALSAPFPPPTDLPPHEEMTTGNIVEIATAGDDDCAFDQPCYYGHRVESHAVYCHNETWPDSPHKCRRGEHCAWIYGIDVEKNKHENCPGFVANPGYKPPAQRGTHG